MTRTPLRLVAAALTSLAVAAMALTAPQAVAEEMAPVATIDAARQASLTVHKYEGPAVGCKNDGTDQGECLKEKGATALAGAEFTLFRITDVDLTTNEGWTKAATYYQGGAPAAGVLQEVGRATTDADGIVKFDGRQVGLYFVKETKAPTLEGGTYTPAAPFYVTLPMTNPDGRTSWMYDVNVYPKNDALVTPHKSVTDVSTIGVGDKMTYDVTTKAPNFGDVVSCPAQPGGSYGAPDGVVNHCDLPNYFVRDVFAPELTVGDSPVASVSVGGVALEAGVDYAVVIAGQRVDVLFLEGGRSAVAASKGGEVKVTFVVTVKSIPDSGVVENVATVFNLNKPGLRCHRPRPTRLTTRRVINLDEPGNPGHPDQQGRQQVWQDPHLLRSPRPTWRSRWPGRQAFSV